MTYDFDLAPLSPKGARLTFQWDSEAGTVSGPDADTVRALASDSQILIQPWPTVHKFSGDPLRSLADMAAIVGFGWQLPAELAEHYPQPPVEPDLDLDGLVY